MRDLSYDRFNYSPITRAIWWSFPSSALGEVMHRYIVTALAISLVATAATAQTWVEQQQMYNEKANLETELFQQREEMERMRQENRRALQEQQRNLQQHTPHLEYAPPSAPSLNSSVGAASEQSARDATRDAENRAFVMSEEPGSIIKFRESHHAELLAALESKGVYLKPYQSEGIRYAWKAMWLRKLKAAERGDAVAQRELGVAFLAEKDIQRDYKQAVKWFRLASKQGDDEATGYLDRMAELSP